MQIDYDSLRRKKNSLGPLSSRPTEDDQEVYDDVAEQDEASRYVQSYTAQAVSSPGIMDFKALLYFTFYVSYCSLSLNWMIVYSKFNMGARPFETPDGFVLLFVYMYQILLEK